MKDIPRDELFSLWKKRMRVAKDLHQEKVVEWSEKIFKEYAGDVKTGMEGGEKYTQMAHVIHGVEQTIRPHLLYQNPTVFAKAKQPVWEKREPLVSAVLNHEYTDIKPSGYRIELENELAILDARLLGYGGTETSWEVEGSVIEEKKPGLKGFFTGIDEVTRTPVIEREIGMVTERFNPLEVYLDYTATHLTKMKWFIRKKDLRKRDLEKTRYEQDKISKVEPSSVLAPEGKFGIRAQKADLLKDPDFKGYRIYEIHDLEDRVIHTIADGFDDFIEFASPYPVEEGATYSFLWFIEVPNQVYPEPPIKYYRKRAQEFSYIYSQVSDQIDKFLPKIGFDVNKLHGADKERMRVGGLGTFVGFDGSPESAMKEISPRVQPDLFQYLNMTKELLNLESGVSEYEIDIPRERTATEASIIQKGTKSRRFLPQKRVKDFIISQANVMWQTLVRNVAEGQFIKVLGANDALEWWKDPLTGKDTWTGEDISGGYAFSIDVESMAPVDKKERAFINTQALQTITNPNLRASLVQEKKQLLVAPLLEKMASDSWGIKDKTKIIRDLTGLEPAEEHDLWMAGQYPPISERELQDPEFLLKHFAAHEAWIQSLAFRFLPEEIQAGAMQHRDSYLQYLAKILPQKGPKNQTKPFGDQPKPEVMPDDEPFVPRTA